MRASQQTATRIYLKTWKGNRLTVVGHGSRGEGPGSLESGAVGVAYSEELVSAAFHSGRQCAVSRLTSAKGVSTGEGNCKVGCCQRRLLRGKSSTTNRSPGRCYRGFKSQRSRPSRAKGRRRRTSPCGGRSCEGGRFPCLRPEDDCTFEPWSAPSPQE